MLTSLLCQSLFFVLAFFTTKGGAVSLTSLWVENKDAPLGIDVIPRFSWNLISSERAVVQTSYQISVSTVSAGKNDQWDSGVVDSPLPYGIVYDGRDLKPDTVYYWTVLVATNVGSATASSTFTTGLLTASDWGSSVWIGKASSTASSDSLNISQSTWIWTSEGGSPAGDRPFRKTLSTPSGKSAISADIIITVDDGFKLFVNGAPVGSSPDVLDVWESAQRYSVPLNSLSNVFAIRATNLADRNNGGDSPAGVLVAIQVNYVDGSFSTLHSDSTWRTLTSTPPTGFEQPGFNDASWSNASVVGNYGVAPWGTGVTVPATNTPSIPAITDANWVWTSEMSSGNAPAGSRPFRKTFATPNGKTAVAADIVITVDDGFQLFANGALIGSSPNETDTWKSAQRFNNVTLLPNSNVFAVLTTNLPDVSTGGASPAGLLVSMFISYSDGTRDSVISDSSWLTIASSPPNGFEQPNFDASSWSHASVLGKYGINPWTTQVSLSESLAEHPAPLLRKEFSVSKTVESARLYYSAGGYAYITLNGQPISDHVLSPGFTKYDTEVQSITIDVKSLLVSGTNALGAELGRSHYGVTQGNVWNWNTAPWHAEPTLRLVLSIGYTDGSTLHVVSDSTWQFIEGPTRLDDVFGGENFDARYRVNGYDKAGFDASAWHAAQVASGPAGTIVNQLQPPTRVVQTLTPVSITQPVTGIYVVAFERNVVGWVQLSVAGPAGTLITIHFGEKLQDDGTVFYQDFQHYYANNFQTDRFWLAGTGAKEVFEPKFSYKGYQYVQLEGWPSGSSPTVEDIVGKVVHDDLTSRGGFKSSNDLLNKLHQASVFTMLNNAHSYPEDCPTYEKNGWSGDAMTSAEGFLANLDSHAFLAQYVRNLDESRPNGSGPPAVIAPDSGWGANNQAPTWHSAFILIPRWLYQYQGDIRLLQTHYASMKNYIEFELGRSPRNLAATGLGDWDTPETSPLGGNPPENSTVPATAFLYRMLKMMQEMASVLGETNDVTTFSNQAAAVKTAFNSAFYNRTSGHYAALGDTGYRQTHNLLALAFDLADNGTQQAVADSIANDVASKGVHLNTGALGTKHLLPVLTKWGHADVAFNLATQTTFPSWGFWIANGATTMWEHWLETARSHNHHFLGTFEDWLYHYVAGIQATGTAFESVLINPALTSQLSSASAWMLTPYGNISSSWTSNLAGSITLEVGIPPSVDATIIIPATSVGAVSESGKPLNASDGVKVGSFDGSKVTILVGSGTYLFKV